MEAKKIGVNLLSTILLRHSFGSVLALRQSIELADAVEVNPLKDAVFLIFARYSIFIALINLTEILVVASSTNSISL